MTCSNPSEPLGLIVGNFTVAPGVLGRGIGLYVGSNNQLIAMKPSTTFDYTWVQNSVDCKSASDYYCIGDYSGVYNYSLSTTFVSSGSSSWNGTGVIPDPTDPADSYIYFNDRIEFGRNGTIYGMPLVTRKQGYIFGNGLGLGPNSTFLTQAVKVNAAPSRDWGLWVGSRSVVAPVNGALWIGGYDTNRPLGQFTEFNAPSGCEFCVQITDLTYVYDGGSASLFSNSSETLSVNLEPYTRFLEIPPDIYGNLVKVTQKQGTYLSNIGALAFYPNASMGNVSVTLNNGYKTVIPASELFMLPRGPNTQTGVYEIQDNSEQITMFSNTTYDGFVMNWGIPYLTMNYLVTDWQNRKFRMAPARQGIVGQDNGALVSPLCSGLPVATATPVASPSASITSPAPNSAGSSKSTNVGAIAGGVVGGVVGLILIAGLIWWILRSKKREKALRKERDAAILGGSEAGPREAMSQTATSPTVTSSVYGGGRVDPYNNSVNQWVHSQNNEVAHEAEDPHSPAPPNSYPSPELESVAGTHTTAGIPQAVAGSLPHPESSVGTHNNAESTATMSGPFEMPAYQYR